MNEEAPEEVAAPSNPPKKQHLKQSMKGSGLAVELK
jgi:hypothetical protein